MRYAFSVDRIGACALKSFTAVAGENRTTCELLWARKEDLASERPVEVGCGARAGIQPGPSTLSASAADPSRLDLANLR